MAFSVVKASRPPSRMVASTNEDSPRPTMPAKITLASRRANTEDGRTARSVERVLLGLALDCFRDKFVIGCSTPIVRPQRIDDFDHRPLLHPGVELLGIDEPLLRS